MYKRIIGFKTENASDENDTDANGTCHRGKKEESRAENKKLQDKENMLDLCNLSCLYDICSLHHGVVFVDGVFCVEAFALFNI